MESINVLNMIKLDVFNAPIDLKDALFSIPTHHKQEKYLKYFLGDQYQFAQMPND